MDLMILPAKRWRLSWSSGKTEKCTSDRGDDGSGGSSRTDVSGEAKYYSCPPLSSNPSFSASPNRIPALDVRQRIQLFTEEEGKAHPADTDQKIAVCSLALAEGKKSPNGE